jgi:plastocyanin
MPLLLRLLALGALAVLGLLVPAIGGAQNPTLTATVGPGFTISLTDSAGRTVTRLDPGTYTINVSDRATIHNFHLSGPGVNVMTAVEEQGETTWTVTFSNGTYTYVCDPHSDSMRGSFTVGPASTTTTTATTTTTPTTTTATTTVATTVTEPTTTTTTTRPAPVPRPARLVATVGPGFTISLTANGRRVTRVRAGAYTIVVRDRSRIHNFHLTGPRVNRRTGVNFRGTGTWRIRLRAGAYRYVCDPHRRTMRGSFRVVA